ncbi:SAM-dependent DNA methyltransferase [Hymenobacter lapidiphilus]|uniref:type I restriction-modification system subunit M n=1 Tax=Hymenobacter sp. CCM 8763 TaxID=2303334 RepID=UPI000E34F6A3|nr:class I SAM-dependent DNA methyltransferase [Hymenobacter sp. CCM 8763]RFP64413.1 SAM-dependent DNA methyltransferase [Hymenobacter sp. CCM 8763]
MLTGDLRNKVDRVWEAFWTGGIANPLTVIEQITYLLFIRRLDELQTARESQAQWTGQPIENPIFGADQQGLRWTNFKEADADTMYRVISQDVFPFMKEAGGTEGVFAEQMKGATFMIPTPNLLERVVTMLSAIDMSDRDTKGDLYEYLLSKVATAGTNGQFRTPRHIIRMMVELMRPTPQDTICDPSAGSCGFLVGAGEYLREHFPEVLNDAAAADHFQNKAFNGIEFDATMIRIGAMNLLLHGIENPGLHYRDALSEANAGIREAYTLVLANPPFKGSLDKETVEKGLSKVVDTKKTELLFLALMLRMLKTGGRAAVIVPDGVLFGSSKAHVAVRKMLIDGHRLEGVVSMPSGVFKPYAGVSTAVLIFTKTNSGGTDQVWFYDMRADGYSLDDKRTPLDAAKPGTNDIPDLVARWHLRHEAGEQQRARTEQSFLVPVADIRAQGYDLSINRYKETVHAEVSYETPQAILAAIRTLDSERQQSLLQLEELLG